MLELVQGEGGVIALDKEYVQAVEKLCKKKDILLMIDEVQTGNGRTGTLYAFQQYGVSPDVMTTAKGLGNGLPVGATLFSAKCEKTLTPGTHGSTFGGNPAACAGAVAVIKSINDKLLKGVEEKALRIRETLLACSKVKSVSGLGLMIGAEVENAAELKKQCLQKGLVVLTAKDRLRLLPPLNIGNDELERGLAILREVDCNETFTRIEGSERGGDLRRAQSGGSAQIRTKTRHRPRKTQRQNAGDDFHEVLHAHPRFL